MRAALSFPADRSFLHGVSDRGTGVVVVAVDRGYFGHEQGLFFEGEWGSVRSSGLVCTAVGGGLFSCIVAA